MPTITYTCQYCEKEFQAKRASKRKFCSLDCYYKGGKRRQPEPRPMRICQHCGKEFEGLNYHEHKFCSRACHYAHWEARPRRAQYVSFTCNYCGKSFKRKKGTFGLNTDKQYCNRQCHQAWQRDNHPTGTDNPLYQRVEVSCEICGKPLNRKPYRLKYYDVQVCSHKCAGIWRSENLTGENHHAWKGGGKYGLNDRLQRILARKRDNYTCRICGITESELGRALDVHHIKPFKEFGYVIGENDNYIQANELGNLISLCISCHHRAEHDPSLLP